MQTPLRNVNPYVRMKFYVLANRWELNIAIMSSTKQACATPPVDEIRKIIHENRWKPEFREMLRKFFTNEDGDRTRIHWSEPGGHPAWFVLLEEAYGRQAIGVFHVKEAWDVWFRYLS